MREFDKKDDQPALGAPIKKPPMPEPHRKVTEDGSVRRDPSGKFYTVPAPPTLWELFGIQRNDK